jgi:hypothetical protein
MSKIVGFEILVLGVYNWSNSKQQPPVHVAVVAIVVASRCALS